jgi:hypothetical protein
MRWLVISLVLTLSIAAAEEPAQRLLRSGHRKRVAGIVLTSLGIAASLATIATAVYFETAPCSSSDCWTSLGATFVSMPLGILSVGLLAAGIPLWAIGDRSIRRAHQLSVGVAPTRDGVVASLRFAY